MYIIGFFIFITATIAGISLYCIRLRRRSLSPSLSAKQEAFLEHAQSKTPTDKETLSTGFFTHAQIPQSLLFLFPDPTETETPLDNKLAMVARLGITLSTEERFSLYVYLRNATNTREELHVKELVCSKLEGQKEFPPEYADTLITFIQDHSLESHFREFMVRRLGGLYDELGRSDQQWTRTILKKVLGYSDDQVVAATITVLANLSLEHPEFDRDEISKLALSIVNDGSHGPKKRAAAIAACARLELNSSLPAIRQAVTTTDDVELLKTSINALGKLGDHSDLDLLHTLAEKVGDDIRDCVENAKNSILLGNETVLT